MREEKSMWTYFKEFFTVNFANFEGRARRKEYWGVKLFFLLFMFPIAILLGVLSAFFGEWIIYLTYVVMIPLFIPSLALSVRRMHDIGKSGWLVLLGLIPFIGGIILFIFYVTEGDIGTNKYGLDPKDLNNNLNDII